MPAHKSLGLRRQIIKIQHTQRLGNGGSPGLLGGRECLCRAFTEEQEGISYGKVTEEGHSRQREQSQQSQRRAVVGCRPANAAFGVRQETLRWTCRQKRDLPLHVSFEFILWARNREPMKSFRPRRAKEKAGEVSIHAGAGAGPSKQEHVPPGKAGCLPKRHAPSKAAITQNIGSGRFTS